MEKIYPKFSFGIINTRGFFEKLQKEYEAFDNNHISAFHAINCALTSWHLTDWAFNEFEKHKDTFQDIEKTKNKDGKDYIYIIPAVRQFQDKLISECPELEYMSWIANGSKHCILRNTHLKGRTLKYEGDFSPLDFSRHDFDVDRFEIQIKPSEKINFEEALLKTMKFWETFINEHDLV